MKDSEHIDLDFWFTLEKEGLGKEDIIVLFRNGYSVEQLVIHFRQLIEEIKDDM